jgi:hypothetical protein
MSGYAEYSGHSTNRKPDVHILQKPFSLASLVQAVRDALEGRSAAVRGEQEQFVT